MGNLSFQTNWKHEIKAPLNNYIWKKQTEI